MNTSTETIMYYIIAAGILSIVYGFITGRNILNSSSGNAKMLETERKATELLMR